MIMGGSRSKVLVAILLRPPEKKLCKQLLGSYLLLDPLPLEFLPSVGREGMDIFWNYTIQKKCNFPAQKIVRCQKPMLRSMLIIFNYCRQASHTYLYITTNLMSNNNHAIQPCL